MALRIIVNDVYMPIKNGAKYSLATKVPLIAAS